MNIDEKNQQKNEPSFIDIMKYKDRFKKTRTGFTKPSLEMRKEKNRKSNKIAKKSRKRNRN